MAWSWGFPFIAVLLHCSAVVQGKNMNGQPGQYKIANPNTLSSKDFSTDYDVEYFDVYSPPIKTRYSEVFWTMMDKVSLPQNIIERFKNKTMAIRGYEVDQVMKTSQGDVSVPITWAYNHHYMAWINNDKVKMAYVSADADAVRLGHNHGAPKYWKPVNTSPVGDIPASQVFSEGNGGEMRLSYHGYPRGYAQLVESPTTWLINPMQIDTKNRDHPGPGFVAGLLPKASLAPPNASYSGLLECPCTDRIRKEWHYTYGSLNNGTCSTPVRNASECFAAGVSMARAVVNRTVADDSLPPACSVTSNANGSASVTWNSGGKAPCGKSAGNSSVRLIGSAKSVVELTVDLAQASQNDAGTATITITGPADVWIGVGFGAQSMCLQPMADECAGGGPYAIIVTGDGAAGVSERKLANHGPGSVLDASITVLSNSVQDNMRTVVVKRGFTGMTEDHYTFTATSDQIPFINAKGSSLTFAQHQGHAAGVLSLAVADGASCLCETGIEATIAGDHFPGNDSLRCAPEPTGDLLKTHNPTCDIKTYSGGLQCCKHGHFLLDAHQEPPAETQEYHLKFRFWFEEYTAAPQPSHQNLVRLYWQTESYAGEYDIVPCDPGTPSKDCIQEITSRWRVRDMMHDCSLTRNSWPCTGTGSSDPKKTAGVKLIYAGPHCHAPDCLSMELYNADTGKLLCHMEPIFGQGVEVFNEKNYVALPPCVWGSVEDGLEEPELLSLDTELLSIKRNNNTIGHYGEMASWQMRGIVVPVAEPSLFI